VELPVHLLDERLGIALVRAADDAVLHVDDEKRSVRAILECGHGLPSD
jgi:hypothetical protein